MLFAHLATVLAAAAGAGQPDLGGRRQHFRSNWD